MLECHTTPIQSWRDDSLVVLNCLNKIKATILTEKELQEFASTKEFDSNNERNYTIKITTEFIQFNVDSSKHMETWIVQEEIQEVENRVINSLKDKMITWLPDMSELQKKVILALAPESFI